MPLYRVKITEESHKDKIMDIRIDTFEEFIKWYKAFTVFEKGKNIEYEVVKTEDNAENAKNGIF